MKKIITSLFAVLLFIILSAQVVYAGPTKITSVSILPTNPGYGDLVQVTVNLCAATYDDPFIAIAFSTTSTPQAPGAGGQVFVVDVNGIDRKDVGLARSRTI